MLLRILNPGYRIVCDHCGEVEAGVIFREVTTRKEIVRICGRCLALAMQDITKQNWLSQWIVWQEISKLGRQISGDKRKDARR